MSMTVMGVDMTPDVKSWDRSQRRVGSLVVLAGAAVVLVVAAILYWGFGVASEALYWGLIVLLLLLLAVQVAAYVLRTRATDIDAPMGHGAHQAHVGPSGPEHAAVPAVVEHAPRKAVMLTLRCGDCTTVFDVTDTGERPLYHTCPGCGAEGVLQGERAAAQAEPAPVAESAPVRSPYAEPEPSSPMVAAPAAPALKKLKLRCGGCKEVFSIEDDGTRPLRRACPHCARIGEIR